MSFEEPASCNDLLNYRIAILLESSGALVLRLCEGRYGISRREWRLIVMLADHGPLLPSELAARAHTDRPLVSRAIRELADKGLVLRSSDPGSGKRARIELTENGRALHRELFPQVVDINRRILGVLTPQQIRAFDETLQLLTGSAKRVFDLDRLVEKADRRNGGSRRTGFRPNAAHGRSIGLD